MTASELLSSARHWQQTGDLPRAEAGYRQLLTLEPANAEIWYLLGAVCQPQGKGEETLAAYRRAVTLKPEFAQAQNSLGIALAQQGRSQEAEQCFAEAVRAQPDFAHAHNNLGNALKEQGRRDEALACYQQAVALKPDFAEAYNNLGNVQRELGQLDDAIANCRQALRLKPDLADAHNNLGAAWSAQRRWEEAATSYRQAIALRPNHAEAHSNLGIALRELGRVDEAILSLRQALQLKSDFAEAHGGLAMALSQQGDLDGALASCREALRLRPDLASAHLSMGFVLSELGRRSEALACCDRALELQPDMPDARKNRSLILLLEGKLAEGWAEYEWRWKCPELPERPFPQPLWDGSALDGKTIMLHAEQGFGDTLHFVRYARLVHERGGRVVVVCQRPLVALLSRCEGVSEVSAQGDPLPPFDVHAPLLSLPRVFGTTLDNIPADVPYLFADAKSVEAWRGRLRGSEGERERRREGERERGRDAVELDLSVAPSLPLSVSPSLPLFKIGIAWQGSRTHRRDRGRSIPLSYFAPLAALSGVQLYSLQKNDGQEQLGQVSFGGQIVDLSPRLESFVDTAAVMENLDLVICCDTSVAHLAGALARPVWVAVAIVPDWRWLLDRDDTPWYPTMRLFRQRRRGDWHDVFARIKSALSELIGAPADASTTVRIGPDELIDRLTRIEIEREHAGAAGGRDVDEETAGLENSLSRLLRRAPDVADLKSELKSVNEKVRETEREIDQCRRDGDFGARFAELARSAYAERERGRQIMGRIRDALFQRERPENPIIKKSGGESCSAASTIG